MNKNHLIICSICYLFLFPCFPPTSFLIFNHFYDDFYLDFDPCPSVRTHLNIALSINLSPWMFLFSAMFLSFYGYIMDSLYSWTSSSSPTYSLMFTLCQILYESSGYFAFVVIQLMILILLINNSREIISLNLIILFSKIFTKLFSVSSTKLCYLIVT